VPILCYNEWPILKGHFRMKWLGHSQSRCDYRREYGRSTHLSDRLPLTALPGTIGLPGAFRGPAHRLDPPREGVQ